MMAGDRSGSHLMQQQACFALTGIRRLRRAEKHPRAINPMWNHLLAALLKAFRRLTAIMLQANPPASGLHSDSATIGGAQPGHALAVF